MKKLNFIVIGLGVQGNKRKSICGSECVGTVDPFNSIADYKSVEEVGLSSFDAALLCTPDQNKYEVIKYLLLNKKHVLVEKPLLETDSEKIEELEALAHDYGVQLYTAYNHRFEPHFVSVKSILSSGDLGQIYRCRMFYGNGTADLVKGSPWKDKGLGVIGDLGSHLIDTTLYWFDEPTSNFELVSAKNYRNLAPDHAILLSKSGQIDIELEMTLLMWKNHFTCDILAENGSVHIESLCKWGPSKLIVRKRAYPSGRPEEHSSILVKNDPTWAAEYQFFKNLISTGAKTSLKADKYICRQISSVNKQFKDLWEIMKI